jgi:hypothetical protein
VSAAFALAATLGLAGCSVGEDDPDRTCDLLTDAQVAELAGRSLSEPHKVAVEGLPICQWGSNDEIAVRAGNVPAEEWATRLPRVLDQLEGSGLMADPEYRRKFEAARKLVMSGNLDGQKACDVFGALLETQGHPPGTSKSVTVVPSQADPQAINGHSCVRGVYSSVQLVTPDLTGSVEEVRRVSSALAQVRTAGTR